ncbi:MAG TPA: radical SAM protein [Candidatus Polarisedimenticolia bacterium]|jgi:wyosine [tRNA(Phe)-imidazoG37] synthetase (radical SAM superfamily)|nr:radical SAM protein [Candidatus Polarisedimenticolia bacterium]
MNPAPLGISRHSRSLDGSRYVYAVLSRRSKGISVGINLNPDKICNFDCIYCQVDRTVAPAVSRVDETLLARELESTLAKASSGSLFQAPPFDRVPEPLRRLADLAFAGDGEPTTYPRFREVVAQVVALKRNLGLDGLKIALLTNCTVLDRPAVRQALALLDESDGEIWAKLDAGTEQYYETVCVPGGAKFAKILANILEAARIRPLVIQSLFLRYRDAPPPAEEIAAFCERLNEVTAGGGRIRGVQVYTVARRPAAAAVSPLSDGEVDAIAEEVRRRTGLQVEAFYGSSAW